MFCWRDLCDEIFENFHYKTQTLFLRKRQYFMHIEPVLELLLPWEHTNRIKKIEASRIRYILSQSILC